MRVLYSFSNRIGAGRICSTAFHQVCGIHAAGVQVTVSAGSQARKLPDGVRLVLTQARWKFRIPAKLVGRWRLWLWHDWLTARWLDRHHDEIDLVHCWPLSSLRTIRVARKHGIPCFMERPNTHTAYAYEAAAEENRILGIELPEDHDHAFNRKYLEREEVEYDETDFLLCPSDFVLRTFRERGFDFPKLVRHHYGYDAGRFFPGSQDPMSDRGLVVIYVGVCEPRKGLHYALQAWKDSGANLRGKFLVCGEFVPGYAEKLSELTEDPSVEILGHRNDVAELMRGADLFVLSSVEEGSALVTYEARSSGCVLVVSDGAGAVCEHDVNALVHPMRDVAELTRHFRMLDEDRARLARLREKSLSDVSDITWTGAGKRLAALYQEVPRDFASAKLRRSGN